MGRQKKIVEIPLFSSYVFAQVSALEQSRVEQAAGVVNIVHHCGKPAKLTPEEIDMIKNLVAKNYEGLETVSFDQVNPGDRIKVRAGILSDWQGEVITVKGKSVVMVLEQFNCALIAKVSVSQQNLLRA
ncbi:antitermination protein NusG [Olivibacter sp. 47]|nr:transcription termination/antitermination NusG family protein [Olivibacter sp. 47]MDM8176744.1 antitermination protein NusG [Olivibacter sp. 47]